MSSHSLWADRRHDVFAGFLVFLLALPLSLGIASASGFPPVMGLLTAIIGGWVGAWVSGSELAVKGPAAGLIVIVAGAVSDLGGGEMGWRMASAAVVAAGLLQILFGSLRWGRLVDFFPVASIHGMMAAIGCIILAKQLPVLLGVPAEVTAGASPFELLLAVPTYGPWVQPSVAWVGGVSLVVYFVWTALPFRWARAVPAPVVVLALAIPLSHALGLTAQSRIVVEDLVGALGVQAGLPSPAIWGTFLRYVLMIAAVGTLESLLTVKAVDGLDPQRRKSDPNRDLRGLGVVNVLSGLLGGLPMISEVARSSANVASGARSRWSVFFHGVWMLLAVVFALEGLRSIPMAALAALLIGVGYKLAHPRTWLAAYRVGPDQLAIFVTTVLFTLFEDLLVGIAAGIVLKGAMHAFRGVALRDLRGARKVWVERGDAGVLVLEGAVVFVQLPGLRRVLDVAPPATRRILDVTGVTWMDHSAMEMLHEFECASVRAGVPVIWEGLAGLQARSDHPLAVRSGVGLGSGGVSEGAGSAGSAGSAGVSEGSAGSEVGAVSVDGVLEDLALMLPTQLALRDFVHHNTLHAFEREPFFEGIFHASRLLGVRVVLPLADYRRLFVDGVIGMADVRAAAVERHGAEADVWVERMFNGRYAERGGGDRSRLRDLWKTRYGVDLEGEVHPRLFRWVGAYLDQGVALDRFPGTTQGLLEGLRELDRRSWVPLFRSRRVRAAFHEADLSVERVLGVLVGPSVHWPQYLWEQQLGHRGWGGFVRAVEQHPTTLLDGRGIRFRDFVLLELLLEWDAVDRLRGESWRGVGWGWVPGSVGVPGSEAVPGSEGGAWSEGVPGSEGGTGSEPAAVLGEPEEVLALWQTAFEGAYHGQVLSAIACTPPPSSREEGTKWSAICCIDDREDSFRRHLEAVGFKTWGAPGFFGVPFYFRPFGGAFLEKLAPVPVEPQHVIVEKDAGQRPQEGWWTSPWTHTPLRGLALTFWLGGRVLIRLAWDVWFPRKRQDHVHAFAHMAIDGRLELLAANPPAFQGRLKVGFSPHEMADRVEALLRGIGWKSAGNAAEGGQEWVLVLGHGSSSANNPHHAAYDCGACSGRPGGVNARVFAAMANRSDVRALLAERGLVIGAGVHFIGALHDTASDDIRLYDVGDWPLGALSGKEALESALATALDRNAEERARRFATLRNPGPAAAIRQSVAARSRSYAEPRPELGHGSNAVCIIGRRERFRSLFLDRRAFHQSYDPTQDPDGQLLKAVFAPLPVVCGGINLEYYFSRMDSSGLGAGTKLSHHVIGLFGVAHSADGDLRPGLPLQMVEIHDPIRLLMVIEHAPEVILGVLAQLPHQKQLMDGEWIRLVAAPPGGGVFRYTRDGFVPYEPHQVVAQVPRSPSSPEEGPAFRKGFRASTQRVTETTHENLPVTSWPC